jgi:ABC-type nitrate/sulfonate/bicarbonate transport system substrate-binding protein
MKAWREANPEKVKAWLKANPEKLKATAKAYRKNNPETVAASSKAYREANREQARASNKAYHGRNREIFAERHKAWGISHPYQIVIRNMASKCKVSSHEIRGLAPQELIEVKLLQLQLHRMIYGSVK